jgi:hypothetical protein
LPGNLLDPYRAGIIPRNSIASSRKKENQVNDF